MQLTGVPGNLLFLPFGVEAGRERAKEMYAVKSKKKNKKDEKSPLVFLTNNLRSNDQDFKIRRQYKKQSAGGRGPPLLSKKTAGEDRRSEENLREFRYKHAQRSDSPYEALITLTREKKSNQRDLVHGGKNCFPWNDAWEKKTTRRAATGSLLNSGKKTAKW